MTADREAAESYAISNIAANQVNIRVRAADAHLAGQAHGAAEERKRIIAGQESKQPEIDALKAEVAALREIISDTFFVASEDGKLYADDCDDDYPVYEDNLRLNATIRRALEEKP